MNTKRLLDTFIHMVSIDSPSFGERELCDYLTACLKELEMEPYEDQAGHVLGGSSGNLYGFMKGDDTLPPLLFSAHMDTVEPSRGKKAVIHKDGRITSDGSTVLGADDLAGIAILLEALRFVHESDLPHRPIEVLFTVAEESYGKGASVFDYSRLKAREGYVLDLTGPIGTAANKAPSILSFQIVIHGKASHAGFCPEEGIHAIMAAAEAIRRMQMGRVGPDTTCNIGRIQGGTALNIVPDFCVVEGEIRSYSHQKALDQMELVARTLEETAKEFGASVEVRWECHMEAYEIDPSAPVVKRFEAVCDALELPFFLMPTFGGSDNNHFVRQGISGIVLANAMDHCHSCAEYTRIEDLERMTQAVIQLMTIKNGY